MRSAGRTTALGAVLVTAASSCGARPPSGEPLGIGIVGSGGGTEIDGGPTSGGESAQESGSSSSSGAASGSAAMSHSGASAGGGGSTGGGVGSGGITGSAPASGTSGTASGSSGEPIDAGTGGIHLTLGGPIRLSALHWTISGPNTYQGSVEFGDAQSTEWVIGGIVEGGGYTLSVVATDTSGDPCQGTSAPFSVEPGTVIYTMITIVCDTSVTDPPDVTTGSVAVEAGVVATASD